METAIQKVEVLIETLNHLRQFKDHLTLIKLGGSAMEEEDALQSTLQSIVVMQTVGLRPILVHGGGKPIDRAMAQAGLKAKKILGRRYTDQDTLKIVVDVLTREINQSIVHKLRLLGGKAIGLYGESLQVLFGERIRLESETGEKIDLGFVGEVNRVDTELLQDFTRVGMIPVIPSLAYDSEGNYLNVNADTAAAGLAAQIQASKLILLTDTPGILRNRHDPNSLIPSLTAPECRQLIAEGIIDAGMIPKVEACLTSLSSGVKKVHIIDGRVRHALLLEIFTNHGIGTEIIMTPPTF